VEFLQIYDDLEWKVPDIVTDVPGIETKGHCHKTMQKTLTLTLEMLDRYYPKEHWIHAFTDGSAEGAVKNGEGGMYIRFSDGSDIADSIPTGNLSTNNRAEACAMLHTARLLVEKEVTTPTVNLTDCKSLLSCKFFVQETRHRS